MDFSQWDAQIKPHIGKITLIGAILGLLCNLIGFLSFLPVEFLLNVSNIIYFIHPYVGFQWFDNYLFTDWTSNDFVYNYMAIAFYGLMLIGYFSYRDAGKTRLVRFTFGIIVFAQAFEIVVMFINFFSNSHFYEGRAWQWQWWLNFGFSLLWAFLGYRIINMLASPSSEAPENTSEVFHSKSEGILDDDHLAVTEATNTDWLETPRKHRFLHYLIDDVLSVLLCSPGIVILILAFSGSWLHEIENNFWIIILSLFCRIFYYAFFESAFGATPGKWLTGSKVVQKDGGELTFSKALARTFVRIIPFEPFSFFDKEGGWHDRWTGTQVVQQKNERLFPLNTTPDDIV